MDTSLLSEGGLLRPRASLADVRFSTGGPGPFVTWREGTSSFTLSWPSPLPEPSVDGDTLVYADVLPDVDLYVAATVDGFRHGLAVRTRAAAANPQVRQIRYRMGGDLRLRQSADGVFELVDRSSAVVGSAAGAWMWDSAAGGTAGGAQATTAVKRGAALPEGMVSDPTRPGHGAATAGVKVALSGSGMAVVPDLALLTDPRTVFPVFIDPPLNKQRILWQYATSNGENNDDTAARVGKQQPDWTGPNGQLYRSYFNFDVSAMNGAVVLDSDITMKLDHSQSCGDSWVHLYRTTAMSGAYGARLAWDAKPLGKTAPKYLDGWAGHANEAGGCGAVQPDADAVFESTALNEDLQYYADGNWDNYSVGLCACNKDDQYESDDERWKKFYTDKTYLIATYDKKPNPPSPQPLSMTTDCYKRCASPAIVRTTEPTLLANVSDPYGGNGPTLFEVRRSASDSGQLVVDNRASMTWISMPGTASWKVPAGKLVHGATYYWRAQQRDENFLWGDWSPWQTLTVDTQPPGTSSVGSAQYPYKQWGAVVGTQGTFTLGNSSDADEFSWWVDGGPVSTVAATGTTTKTASVTYTPATDMVHTFHVKAKDLAGNTGPTFDHQFWVAPAPNRYARWKLDETTGTTAADSGSGGSALAPGTLAGSVAFAPGYLGNGASFTGNGQITTSDPVLDTTKSFTVMAWGRPADLTANAQQTVLSQDGVSSSRLQLQYRADANAGAGGWCFTMSTTDGGGQTSACADGVTWGLPAPGTWVHLAGVYDATTGKMRVYVMGDPWSCGGESAEMAFTASWSATGPFVIGRGQSAGAASNHWRGDVDDVFAFQRVLSAAEICQQAVQ